MIFFFSQRNSGAESDDHDISSTLNEFNVEQEDKDEKISMQTPATKSDGPVDNIPLVAEPLDEAYGTGTESLRSYSTDSCRGTCDVMK